MVAVTRPGFDLGTLQIESTWPKIHFMEMPLIDISASDIRSRVRAGRPIDFLVPDEVAGYIRQHGLYIGEAES
jgi:nicotinate-nucleotide adenylyltransferase